MTIAEINAVVRVLREKWPEPAVSFAKRPSRMSLGSQERPVIEHWLATVIGLHARSRQVVSDLVKHKVLKRNRAINLTLDGEWYDLDHGALDEWHVRAALTTEGRE